MAVKENNEIGRIEWDSEQKSRVEDGLQGRIMYTRPKRELNIHIHKDRVKMELS